MSLRGSLDTFALPDVLALLATTAKSGELHVTGPSGDGRVWLDGGLVVGAEDAGTTDAVDVVVGLLRLDEGDFAFHGDRAAPDAGEPVDVAGLLERAETRLADWREVEQVLPSADAVLRLVPTAPGAVRLSREQWAAVVAIGEGRTVDELVGDLGGDELHRWRLLVGLVEAGLAEVGTDAVASPVAPVARGELAEQLSTLTVAALAEADEAPTQDELEPVPVPLHDAADGDDLEADDLEADDLETDEEDTTPDDEPVPAAVTAHPTEPADGVSRGTLLKFLSSVRS